MTSPQRFEQDLSALLADLYLAGTPDYRDDIVRQTARTRQRPAWTFPERWLPMDIATQRVPFGGTPWRRTGVLALIALLALASAVAVYIGSKPRLPEPFGLAANGPLAYVSGGDLLVRDSIDAPARALADGPERETYAVFSPLGDRLAVTREVAGGDELWVGGADGSDLQRIGGPFSRIDWIEFSPDGTQIALERNLSGIPVVELIATDGSGSRRLVDFPATSPTFRPPNGDQLIVRGQVDGRWSFYLVDVAGGDPVRLAIDGAEIDGGGYDLQGPAWSPTGDRLAFHTLVQLPDSQGGTPGFRISVASIAADGTATSIRPLEFDPFSDDELNAVFTPDGESIVFQQRFGLFGATDYRDAAWIAPADGSGTATPLGIASENGDGIGIAISPDGRSVLAHLWTEEQDWVVDPAAGAAKLTDIASTSGVSWQRRAR